MSTIDEQKIVYNRLDSIYKDLNYALKSDSQDQTWNIAIENDIIKLIGRMKKAFPQNDQLKDLEYIRMNPNSLSKKGQTMLLLTQVRKLADVVDFKFELDRNEQQISQNVFNIIQNQSVAQNVSLIYHNMVSNINQLDLDIETKQKIVGLIDEFKEESNKSKPDFKRLLNILKEVGSMSKIAVAMLSYWAAASGILDKILHHIVPLLK